MASSSVVPEPSSPIPAEESSDKDLQQFFVLHKALPQKVERKESKSRKTRKKIDLFRSSSESRERSGFSPPEEDTDDFYEQLRLQALGATWSEVESAIGESLRQTNLSVFGDVRRWVFDSFAKIKSTGLFSVPRTLCQYPLVTDGICRQIFAALIMTQNMESIDGLSTFQDLNAYLTASGCHVAKLSSSDITIKHGVAGCLRTILRQLLMVPLDSHDMSTLASWYSQSENYGKPIVVIIDDMEQCNGSLLTEFISMISEWIIKIPIILVLGVATTIDAISKLLQSDALQHLNFFRFTLASPLERLNVIVETILAKPYLGFTIGHDVTLFLRNYFSRQDGTITSLIRSLKIACTKHFSMEPLSFLGHSMHNKEVENAWIQMCEALPSTKLMYAFDLPSCQRENFSRTGLNLVQGLSNIQKLWKGWASVLMCLFEVGKLSKMPLLDIFCEAVDPTLHDAVESSNVPPSLSHDQKSCSLRSGYFSKGGLITQAIQKVRELPVSSLTSLLETWARHTVEIDKVYYKVRELQTLLSYVDNEVSRKQQNNLRKNLVTQCCLNLEGTLEVNEKAACLAKEMVIDLLKPIELAPFHEIFCFKQVAILQSALIGDPRRMMHIDLFKSPSRMKCSCCPEGEDVLTSTMHETSILYHLAQEHGDFVNLHDWYQSFKMIIMETGTKRKKLSASKKADTSLRSDVSEASIQARFCRAVTELQITGLIRMPSKRRPDYVQRVVLGL